MSDTFQSDDNSNDDKKDDQALQNMLAQYKRQNALSVEQNKAFKNLVNEYKHQNTLTAKQNQILTDILTQNKRQNFLTSEQNDIMRRQTQIIEEGLAGIETTIGESMKELIDSQQESRYKEMLLLVDDYTQNVLSSTPESFKKVIRRWQKLLRKNVQRWDELDSEEKGLSIDFNYELFIREARLWKDHAFSSSSLDYQEVQRQMIMFVTMYTLIDKRKAKKNRF